MESSILHALFKLYEITSFLYLEVARTAIEAPLEYEWDSTRSLRAVSLMDRNTCELRMLHEPVKF